MSDEIISMKSDCVAIRLGLSFLNKNDLLITMPSVLKKHYNHNDFESISKLFLQALPYLKRFHYLRIFQSVYREIDRILSMTQDVVITLIEKNLHNKKQMIEYTNILLDLQYNYQEKHIQTDNPLSSTFQETHNFMKMIEYLKNKLTAHVKMNTTIESHKNDKDTPSQSTNDD